MPSATHTPRVGREYTAARRAITTTLRTCLPHCALPIVKRNRMQDAQAAVDPGRLPVGTTATPHIDNETEDDRAGGRSPGQSGTSPSERRRPQPTGKHQRRPRDQAGVATARRACGSLRTANVRLAVLWTLSGRSQLIEYHEGPRRAGVGAPRHPRGYMPATAAKAAPNRSSCSSVITMKPLPRFSTSSDGKISGLSATSGSSVSRISFAPTMGEM